MSAEIDILVNNAQIQLQQVEFERTTVDDVEVVLGSGRMGTFHFMQACFTHLRRRGGKIIDVASAAGLVGYAGSASHAAAKEGIRALTKVAPPRMGPTQDQRERDLSARRDAEHEGMERHPPGAREGHGRVDFARPFR